MYWTIPISSEPVPRRTVPPVRVESTIGEQGEFSQDIELEHRDQQRLLFFEQGETAAQRLRGLAGRTMP